MTFKGSVIFADDVRLEIGGKLTVVGLYRGVLGLRDAKPLPKFVALLLLQYSKDLVGQTLTLSLRDRGKVHFSTQVPLPGSNEQAIPASALPEEVYYAAPIEMHGFPVEDGMRLKLTAEVADLAIESDELAVTVLPAVSGTPPPATDAQ